MARILGISVNDDGSIRSIRQSKFIKQGEEIPAGWNFGQWGRNQGGNNKGQEGGNPAHDKDGLVYEVRSNRFAIDMFSGEPTSIEEGGYVLVENLPQLIHNMMDDFDKALGMQYAGANALPSADKSNVLTYEGLHTLVAEIAYSISAISQQISQTLVSSNINQAMLYEVLKSFGLPCAVREFKVDYGDEGGEGKIPYPGLANDAPTLVTILFWLLMNQSVTLGTSLGKIPKIEEEE